MSEAIDWTPSWSENASGDSDGAGCDCDYERAVSGDVLAEVVAINDAGAAENVADSGVVEGCSVEGVGVSVSV